MMAFFFTRPISSTMPMIEMTLRSYVEEQQRQHGADAGRGQGGDDGQRMHQALVQDAQHDVDGQQRGRDQDRLGAPGTVDRPAGCRQRIRGWWTACPAGSASRDDRQRGVAKESPGARLKETVTEGNRPV